ncbi:DUF3996 domain-containing protein [Borrelia sp. BU AG58]|uniref:DUF3996 domain-containing protein n=1 Tax=Borrelia sp. BU AG58 TaxID=2887345 RepID=UPI001E28BD4C|nr:DUF3996 domain-containing protein [Borrelia sp. BU AG58]UER67582.1 DUF3996 domain-containing protein [Borrelia sp. BU AG58]
MGRNTRGLLILLLIFVLHYFAFSKSVGDAYKIKCNTEDDGTTCITNNNQKAVPKPKPTPPKPRPKPTPPPPTVPRAKIAAPVMHKEKTVYDSLALGVGTGSPVGNILFSMPYVDIDLGYGSFIGFKPGNFQNYILFGLDLVFKKEIGPTVIVGGGFGIGADWSKVDLVPPGNKIPTTYERIGTVTRLPISMEYKFAKNLSLGLKFYPSFGPTILLTKPKIVYEGVRFKFFAVGFIKFTI